MKKNIILISLLLQMALLIAQTNVSIDFSQPGGANLTKFMGGYSPEKVMWKESVADTAKTLGPLKVKLNRLQISVNNQTATNPNWVDELGAHQWIIQHVQFIGGTNFLTVNTPNCLKGDNVKIATFYKSLATQIAAFSEGHTIYLELFGEPDLSVWDWYTLYNNGFEYFWNEFNIAYQELDKIRKTNPNLKIGGCGFGGAPDPTFDRSSWFTNFITRIKEKDIKLDFISWHYYFCWKDSDWLINTDQNREITRISRVQSYIDDYKASSAGQGRTVENIWSEFSWPHGDWNTAFSEAKSFLTYRNCARTFESLMYMPLTVYPGKVDKIFWAQGLGQYIEGWFTNEKDPYNFQTFFPFVNWNFYKNGTTYYTYNAAYYAFWFYDMMPENRHDMKFSDNNIRGFASSDSSKYYVVAWNRTSASKNVVFNFKGLSNNIKDYLCTVYYVNNKNYDKNKQFLTSEVIKLDNLDTITLEPEATIMFYFTYTKCKLQTVTSATVTEKNTSDLPFLLKSTTSSGLPVIYSILSGPATISGDTVILKKIKGEVNILALQRGDYLNCPSNTTITFNVLSVQGPYHTLPLNIPGTVEAEDFDSGGEGLAYHDLTIGNIGGKYRPNEDVDIAEGDGNYFVGWTQAGEWLKYTVNVKENNTYLMRTTFATSVNATFRMEIDGIDKTGSIQVNNNDSWEIFDTLNSYINLPAGQHVMRVLFETGNLFIGKFIFDLSNSIFEQQDSQTAFSLFPNPAFDNITVKINLGVKNNEMSTVKRIMITDIQGRLLVDDKEPFTNQRTLSLKGLEDGVYFIKILVDDYMVTKKVMIYKK